MSDSISASFKLLHQYIRHVPGEKSESAAKEIEKVFSYGVPVLSGTFEKSASPLLSCKEDALSHGCAETEGVLQQIEKVFDILPWEYTYKQTLDDPGAGSGIGWAELIGPKAPYRSGDYCLGFTLIAPDTYYPPHHHPASEIYVVLSGTAEWTCDGRTHRKEPGEMIYHPSEHIHSIKTEDETLLALYIWTGEDILTSSSYV